MLVPLGAASRAGSSPGRRRSRSDERGFVHASAAAAAETKQVDGRRYGALARALLKARTAAERDAILTPTKPALAAHDPTQLFRKDKAPPANEGHSTMTSTKRRVTSARTPR